MQGRIARHLVVATGVLILVLSCLGLLFNISFIRYALHGGLQKLGDNPKYPYIYYAWYTMLTICTIFYFLFIICGVQLLRFRLRTIFWLNALFVLECVYFIALFVAPTILVIRSSVAVASGVNSGLMLQWFVLLPVWAPWALLKARRSIETCA
jgi:hypothetical protein